MTDTIHLAIAQRYDNLTCHISRPKLLFVVQFHSLVVVTMVCVIYNDLRMKYFKYFVTIFHEFFGKTLILWWCTKSQWINRAKWWDQYYLRLISPPIWHKHWLFGDIYDQSLDTSNFMKNIENVGIISKYSSK